MTWRELGELVIWFAAIVTAVGILWKQFVGPFVFRPLGAVIQDALDDKLEEKLGPIRRELTTNGGTSLKDAVVSLQASSGKIEGKLTKFMEESAEDRSEIWQRLADAGLGRRNDDVTLEIPLPRDDDQDRDEDGSY